VSADHSAAITDDHDRETWPRMTSEKRLPSSVSATSVGYAGNHDADGSRAPASDSPDRRNAAFALADRIVGLVDPSTALDLGCADGLLVQALVSRGVDAYGRDSSERAVDSADGEVRDRLSVAAATSPIDRRYDLVICVDVLERLSAEDAQTVIDAIGASTDRVLFSSAPDDFGTSGHVNVHPTAQWAAWFAERGFYRRTDADLTFLASWAVLFERGDLTRRAIVERYETQLAPLQQEVLEKRRSLLDATRQIEALQRVPREVADSDASIMARHAALVARDNVIGLEAQIGTLENQLAEARHRVKTVRARLQQRDKEITELRSSRSWRVGRAILRPAAWFKR
jgi:trans-aconitate methyltransferase